MKWSSGESTITKKDDAELRNKVEVFQYQTGTKSAIMLTMITAFGVKHNVYYDTIQAECARIDKIPLKINILIVLLFKATTQKL